MSEKVNNIIEVRQGGELVLDNDDFEYVTNAPSGEIEVKIKEQKFKILLKFKFQISKKRKKSPENISKVQNKVYIMEFPRNLYSPTRSLRFAIFRKLSTKTLLNENSRKFFKSLRSF